jgi:hypothetical protein
VNPEPVPGPSLPGDAARGASVSGGPGESGPWSCAGLSSWVDDAGWAQLSGDLLCDELEPVDLVSAFYDDPDVGPPLDGGQESWELLSARAARDGAEYQELIARLAAAGYSESAHVKGEGPVPGSPEGPAAGFGQGCPLDAAAPSTVLSGLADEASGEDRSFTDVSDDQLMGLIGARQRLISRQHWEELTAVAEFIRRRPDPDADPGVLVYGMPAAASEDAAADLAAQLHISASMAASLIHLAWDLIVKLPLTRAALRDGIIDVDKARGIAMRCLPLTPGEARRAERILFGADVEEMTAGMIRDRIGRAVIEVDPGAARKRREDAERAKRVEIYPELSGNTRICGRELPPALALLASQNLDARARELKAAGISGDMDNLRALAMLEMFGAGTPPGAPAPGSNKPGTGTGTGGGGLLPGTWGSGAAPGQVPPGFAANVNLTINLPDLTLPLLTFLGLAERPGMLSRAGPVDPGLARTLAAAAARNPGSTWCITVTGTDHRPVAHGCGRPPRKPGRGKPGAARQSRPREPARDGPAGQPGDNHDPPGTGTATENGTGTGTGTMRLNIAALTGNTTSTRGAGDLEFTMENLDGPCDHAHQAAGHDPGVTLKHLTGILNQYCTFLTCRRPHRQSDYEHSTPFDKGGRTCLCDGGPVCRHHHRDKQAPGWHLERGNARGWFRWTTASGRTYTTGPTQYPD